LVLPSYLMTILGAQKCLGKHAWRTLSPNALGPGSSGLRLCHFFIIVPTMMRVACTVLGACPIVSPYELDGMSEARVPAWVARPEMGQAPCRCRCGPSCNVIHHGPLQAGIGTARSQDKSLSPPL
jgi:hypothetical protein